MKKIVVNEITYNDIIRCKFSPKATLDMLALFSFIPEGLNILNKTKLSKRKEEIMNSEYEIEIKKCNHDPLDFIMPNERMRKSAKDFRAWFNEKYPNRKPWEERDDNRELLPKLMNEWILDSVNYNCN